MEEQEETPTGNQPPGQYQSHSDPEGSPIAPSRRAKHNEQEPVTGKNESNTPSDKQANLFDPHNLWKFLIEPRHSNAVVAIFTILLFVSTVSYTIFAALQWTAMRATLSEMRIQNKAQERAILTIDNTAHQLERRAIAIRINNQGRRPATIISYQILYRQIVTDAVAFQRQQEIKPNSVVSIENPYIISVNLPQVPPYTPGKVWNIKLLVRIYYDDSFGAVQSVSSCFTPGVINDDWQATCMRVNSVDLSQKLPTDVVARPQTPKK